MPHLRQQCERADIDAATQEAHAEGREEEPPMAEGHSERGSITGDA